MKAMAESGIAMQKCLLEALCYVVRVHVMNGLHAKIRQSQFGSASQFREHARVKMACRIQGRPPLSDDVPGMEDRHREVFGLRFNPKTAVRRWNRSAYRCCQAPCPAEIAERRR